MQRILFLPALAPMFLALAACDDLGECDDPNEGRNPVLTPQGRVMYAGQAVLIASCATGCHASDATRDNRRGAPAGLDFDIVPVNGTGIQTVAGKTTAVADPSALSGLRVRQRKVFDQRENIWEQIQDGLMPPDGIGENFQTISPGSAFSVGSGGCTRSQELAPFAQGSTREILRNWLACGAPIVEINSDQLTVPVGGSIGDQFPACGSNAVALEPTFENVYNEVFKNSCVAGCHEPGGAQASFDLQNIDIAYKTLLGDGQGAPQPAPCADNDSPYVTPGDPAASYLYAKIGGGDLLYCDSLMPLGPKLPADLIDLVARWITAGAPAPSEGGGTADGGM